MLSFSEIFVVGFGIEFVDFFFETMLLVEGAGGFLHTVFVVFHLFFDLLDTFKGRGTSLNAVSPSEVNSSVHQDVVILDVGDSGLFEQRLLPDSGSSEKMKVNYRDNLRGRLAMNSLAIRMSFSSSAPADCGEVVVNLIG